MRERLETLQVGRAVAALLVVAYHASGTIFADPRFWGAEPFNGFFRFGHAGVYFFFVLSGFIIATAHWGDLGRPDRLSTYAARRFIRVYPVYWLVLIPLALLYLFKPEISKPDLTSHSVILNSFALVGVNSRSSLAVAWTLFHEVLFYALFGLAIYNRRLGIVVLSIWFAACAVKWIALPASWPSLYALNRINLLFALGLLAFGATRALTVRNKSAGLGALAVIGAVLFLTAGILEGRGVYALGDWLLFAAYSIGSMLTVVGLVMLERRRALNIPKWALLLGNASYAIYLVHYPALSIIARLWLKVFGKAGPISGAFVIIVLICTLCGVIFHIVIERPLTRYLNQRWKNRDQRPEIAK